MSTLKKIIKEHIRWRGQILKLAKSDLIKTYSGTALSWAWALIKPALTIAMLWFAFSFGLRSRADIGDFPFILWLIPGYISWWYMSDMLTKGSGSIRKYRYLVTKMKFPVSTIPTIVAMATLAVHVALMIIVVGIFIATGHFPDVYWLQLPIYMLFMVMFSISWGLFSSMLGAMSKDFLNFIKSISTPLFWLSGIIWDLSSVDIPALQTVLYFNPITYIVTGYRNCFVYKVWIWDQPLQLGIYAGMYVAMVLLAIWSYRKLIREIPDVL